MKPNNKLIRECSKVEYITFNDKTRKAVVRAYADNTDDAMRELFNDK